MQQHENWKAPKGQLSLALCAVVAWTPCPCPCRRLSPVQRMKCAPIYLYTSLSRAHQSTEMSYKTSIISAKCLFMFSTRASWALWPWVRGIPRPGCRGMQRSERAPGACHYDICIIYRVGRWGPSSGWRMEHLQRINNKINRFTTAGHCIVLHKRLAMPRQLPATIYLGGSPRVVGGSQSESEIRESTSTGKQCQALGTVKTSNERIL